MKSGRVEESGGSRRSSIARGRRTGYLTGSIFNKVIHAETVETAGVDAVKSTLLDTANVKDKLLARINAESESKVGVDVQDLKAQRERLKKRTELIVANLDEETLADAQSELNKLKVQRRLLDEQIAGATNTQMQTVDADRGESSMKVS